MDEFENVTKSLAPKSGLITRAVPWILSFALELQFLYLQNVKNINTKKNILPRIEPRTHYLETAIRLNCIVHRDANIELVDDAGIRFNLEPYA